MLEYVSGGRLSRSDSARRRTGLALRMNNKALDSPEARQYVARARS